MKLETYTAPSCWASYLINGDASGIDNDDQREADAFVESVGAGSPVDCADAGFIHRPDFGKLAGDCQTYTFLRRASSDYNRARANCSCRHHAFPCAKCATLKPCESTAEGTRIDYDGTIYTVTGKSYEYHAGRDEEITIVTLADDEGNECRATLDELKGCQRWASSPTHTLKSLLALTGHYYQPFAGGFQVFHRPGATTGDPRYWSLTDAHVVGLLSGPSLHIVTTDTAARKALAGKGDK